ncbi:MAG: MerR family transcriptional regulator [Anaerolineaceae bacterium]|nr:MerR family transcriptional regulator [Anaerolineaceae bacterium]
MAQIIDLSDEPRYTIKNVCTQTGIRPVTLRAWERRHAVLTPHRSENRYRLYSDRDIALLQWIKHRVDHGVTISSAVSELRTMLRKGIWPEAIPTHSQALPQPRVEYAAPQVLTQQLYQALIKHNEAEAGDLLRDIHATHDLDSMCRDILAPALEQIGEAWYRGEIRITTEHFASNLIRGKLHSLMQVLPLRRGAPLILVGCAPEEQHEIGSLMLALLLRSRGQRVEYLGANVPLEDLADYAGFERPAMIILSAVMQESAHALRRFDALLSTLHTRPVFGFGGQSFVNEPSLQRDIPGIYLGNTIYEAVANVQQQLQSR